MKRLQFFLVLTLALAFGTPAWAVQMDEAPAEPAKGDEVAIDLSVPYYSKYVSRGLTTTDDPVLQPGATLSYKGFCFNVWGNYNLTDKIGKKDKFTEVDLTGEYAFEVGDFTIPVGVVHYLYPNNTQPGTTEIYAGVSYKWLVTPALKVYRDVGDVNGTYANLTVSREFLLLRPKKTVSVGLVPLAGLGWGSADFNKYRYNAGVDAEHFTDTTFQLTLPVKFRDTLTITPGVHHVWLPDSEIQDAAGYEGKTLFSLTFGLSF